MATVIDNISREKRPDTASTLDGAAALRHPEKRNNPDSPEIGRAHV